MPIGAHFRGVGIHLRTEITQNHQRLCFAQILERHAGLGSSLGAEIFVFGELGKTNELRTVERMPVDLAHALNANEAVGAIVADGALDTGFDGELFCGEKLLLLDTSVNDPTIHIAGAACIGHGNGLEVMVVLEVGVKVAVPVQLVDDEVDVVVVCGGHVFDQKLPRNVTSLDKVLIHSENVTTPLGFVSAEGPWGVEYARRNEPAGARLQAVGAGEVKDSIVSLVPIGDAFAHLILGCAGLQPHESVGEIVPYIVMLGREIVGLGLSFLTHQLCLSGALVHVVGDGPHVVEEFRVNRPLVVLAPNRFSDQEGTTFRDSFLKCETVFAGDHVGKPLIVRAVVVGGGRRGCEPAFVDPTTVQAKCVEVVRVQFEALAGLQKGARHPARGQAQEAAGGFQLGFDRRADVRFQGVKGSNVIHGFAFRCSGAGVEFIHAEQKESMLLTRKTHLNPSNRTNPLPFLSQFGFGLYRGGP